MTYEEAMEVLERNKPTSDTRECGRELCNAVDVAIKALQIADRLEQVRLIDANALKDCFEMRGDSDLGWHLNEVLEEIDEQPTAYDVDKVVEKLEMESCVNLEDVYKEAIDIVKRGGVDD